MLQAHLAASGITNFSAVCVSEKLTTFTSTRPAALPAAITARSEISGRPFGRITHSAPFCFIDVFSTASRASSLASIAAKDSDAIFFGAIDAKELARLAVPSGILD